MCLPFILLFGPDRDYHPTLGSPLQQTVLHRMTEGGYFCVLLMCKLPAFWMTCPVDTGLSASGVT